MDNLTSRDLPGGGISVVAANAALQLNPLGSIDIGPFDESAAEISAYDAATQRLFVINSNAVSLDVVDVSDPSAPSLVTSIALDAFGAGGNSVATANGIVAVAIEAEDPTANGTIVFLDTDGNQIGFAEAGVLPDAVTFSPDGTKLVVANEGEPVEAEDAPDGVAANPEGSVSIIDLSGGLPADPSTPAPSTVVTFTALNGQEDVLRAAGLRLFPGVSAAEDLEPEFVSVAPDNRTAFVTLQENNAVAVIDIETGSLIAVQPLGTKDHSLAGNGIDPSDRDDAINIAPQPVQGLYQPDAIATYEAGGQLYYVTANEGDARLEEARVEDLTLDPTAFPDAAALQDEAALGRLQVSPIDGDTDGDGDIDALFPYGARSFSIFDAAGNLVFDSGDDFEQITAEVLPEAFNASNDETPVDDFDSRSDAKGPEPEGVVVGEVAGQTYAFIGLERIGGVMVYDITDPADVSFTTYINTANPEASPEDAPEIAGDFGPEGLTFISAQDSPTDNPLLAVSFEVSGTVTLFDIETLSDDTGDGGMDDENFQLQLLHASDLEGGVDAIDDAPNFAALTEAFEADLPDNTVIVSAGDNYIPGAFFSAAALLDDQVYQDAYTFLYGQPFSAEGERGRVDITIMNLIGFDASAVGNHEFDAGPGAFADIIAPAIEDGDEDGTLDTAEWLGANFPYLSANLAFSGEGSLSGLFTDEILPSGDFAPDPADLAASAETPKLAEATIVEVGGEMIGIVGGTTQILESITSTGGVEVEGDPDGNDIALLAEQLQEVIDALEAAGVNKIVTTTHLQQFTLEEQLVPLLDGVDIAIAGGSDTLLANDGDVLRPGDTADLPYPVISADAAGDPVAIVSTDGEYSYVGRLLAEFTPDGTLIAESVGGFDGFASGPYATTDEVVAEFAASDPFAEGTKAGEVQAIVGAVSDVVSELDGNIFGATEVFLDGRRESVRTEETNLGNLTADANLAAAQSVDETVQVSLKNGGGIRAPIGTVGMNGELLPPEANPDSGAEEGDVSQLDIVDSLRFNNGLTLLSLTPEQLLEVLEYGVGESFAGSTPGRFPQLGGVRFSFTPPEQDADGNITQEAEVESVALVNDDGSLTPVVEGGEIVDGAPESIRIVTLNFLANGGDGYPFEAFVAADPEFANRVDLLGEESDEDEDLGFEDLNLNGVQDAPVEEPEASQADFADFGSEQDAIAEFLADLAAPFASAETDPAEDERIQNLSLRADTVLGDADGGDDGDDGMDDGDDGGMDDGDDGGMDDGDDGDDGALINTDELPILVEQETLEQLATVTPGSLPGEGGGTAFLSFLGGVATFANTVGYYFYDLATLELGEGFAAFASSDDAELGDALAITVPDGSGVVPFLIADGANLGVDFTAFVDGGITFTNPETGGPAFLDDEVAPVVNAFGTPTGLTPFHGFDDSADLVNELNPDGLLHADISFAPTGAGDIAVVAFEDLTDLGDGDFNDTVLALSGEPVNDLVLGVLTAETGLAEANGFANEVVAGPFADIRDEDALSFAELVGAAESDGLYVNVHSFDFPAGEIRGQLFEIEDGDAAVLSLAALLTPEAEVVAEGAPDPAGVSEAFGLLTLEVDLASETYDAELAGFGLTPDDLNPVGGPDVDSPIHLHLGEADANGPIVVNLGAPGGDGAIFALDSSGLGLDDLMPTADTATV